MPNEPLSLEDTSIAFAGLTDGQLKRAHAIFRMVKHPLMVTLGKRGLQVARLLRLPINALLRSTFFAHFCGGESIEDCSKSRERLSRYRVGSILDYSVEGKHSDEGFEATCQEVLRTMDIAGRDQTVPFAVIKVTGIASLELLEAATARPDQLDDDQQRRFDALVDRVRRLCSKADSVGTSLLIDAEHSWLQGAIDSIVEDMMRGYNTERVVVYHTTQHYRTDRLEYLRRVIEEARAAGLRIGMKLVRGAYLEKERDRAEEKGYPSPVHATKEATDADFDAALVLCMDHLDTVSLVAGTHNEKSSLFLVDLMKERGIDPSDERVFFSQLYGMSDHISFNLADAGYNVAKYVPYGPLREVMPYLIRRAEENTSVTGQTGRELMLINRELKRRAQLKA